MTDQLRQAAMQQALVDVITVTLMREGINKHRARELADHFVNFTLTPPLPVQEPVAWLYPEGLEALQNGKCWTAYPRSHEDCNIPLYIATPPQQQAEPLPEWPLIKNILDEYGLDAIAFVADWKAAQQQAEPIAWDKPSVSFNEWWDSYRHDNANPFDTDSFAYWAWAGWKAALAQRQWVGLTDEEIFRADPRIGTSDSNVNPYQILINARAIEAKLKEKNHD
jgi:hypothetical protein